jgi:serine/threonine protein phosphatase PrpC
MAKHFFGLTDTGRTRDNNEDSFIAEIVQTGQLVLAAVIDGVGGYQGGEIAAAIAREEILKKFAEPPAEVIPQLIEAFKEANQVISLRKQTDAEHAEMACVATVVLADIEHNLFYYAHVGDTRLYLLRDGSLIKISKDHSFVGFLEDSGRLNESAAMKHPKRNEINKAIGFSDQFDTDDSYIETGQSPFLPGDLLLLCSDGLTDMVDKAAITEIITQPGTLDIKAHHLVALANENGGRDNITVVLVQNHKEPQKIDPTKPILLDKTDTLPVQENPDVAPIQPQQIAKEPTKKSYGFLALAIFCLLLLASTIVLFLRQQPAQHAADPNPDLKLIRNDQEKLLQDAFDHVVGDTLILADSIFKNPIIISDTLRIRKDTLYVLAKGIVLQADSSYKGTGLSLSSTCKLIGLDSLQLKGFATAISVGNSALHLKNVMFTNCLMPIQHNYVFPNQQPVSLELPASAHPNSIVKPTIPKNGAK